MQDQRKMILVLAALAGLFCFSIMVAYLVFQAYLFFDTLRGSMTDVMGTTPVTNVQISPQDLPDRTLLNLSEQETRDYLPLLTTGQYEELDHLFSDALQTGVVTALGRNEEENMMNSLSAGPDSDDAYQARLSLLRNWVAQRPDSLGGHVALADVLTDYAWYARGGGYSNTVTDEGWKNLHDRLIEAQEVLHEVDTKRQNSTQWYCEMETIGMGLQVEKDDYMKIVEEGSRFHPQDLDVYSGAMIYLLPRWFGSNAELKDFLGKYADRVGGDAGDMLYTRMAVDIWRYDCSTDVIGDVGFSWPRINRGFFLLYQKYPSSQRLMIYYTAMAVRAGDRTSAKILFTHLGDDKVVIETGSPWPTQDIYDCQRAWAFGN